MFVELTAIFLRESVCQGHLLNLWTQLPHEAIAVICPMLNPPPAQRDLSLGSYSTNARKGSGIVLPHQCAQVAQTCQSLGILLICQKSFC